MSSVLKARLYNIALLGPSGPSDGPQDQMALMWPKFILIILLLRQDGASLLVLLLDQCSTEVYISGAKTWANLLLQAIQVSIHLIVDVSWLNQYIFLQYDKLIIQHI